MARKTLLALILTFLPALGNAGALSDAPLDELKHDFAPVKGFLILVRDDLCLTDLDATSGVMAGDLLVIEEPADKLAHPVTGKTLAVGSPAHAILRVTQVDRGFSRAVPVTSGALLKPGMPVTRYANLTAYVSDDSGDGLTTLETLKAALPQLLWQGYRSGHGQTSAYDGSDLEFRRAGGNLDILYGGSVIRSYPWSTEQPHAADRRALSGPFPTDRYGQVSGGPAAAKDAISTYLGRIDEEITAAAFMRERDQIWLAATSGRNLRLFQVDERLQAVSTIELPQDEAALTINWWQPVPSSGLYLVVTSAIQSEIANSPSTETRIVSTVYRHEHGTLTRYATVAGQFLHSVDGDGDGAPEILLGQGFNPANPLEPVMQVTLTDGQLRSAPATVLPSNGISIQGTALGDLDGDGHQETIQVENGFLVIRSGGRETYRSSRKFGGSLARLTYDRMSGGATPVFTTRVFELPPVTADLDQDGHPELIAVGADVSAVRAPGVGPGITESWLSIIRFDGQRYLKSDMGPGFEFPIQGLWADGNRIFSVTTHPANLFGQDGHSEVIVSTL